MMKSIVNASTSGNDLFPAIKRCIDSARHDECDKHQSIRWMCRALLLITNSGLSVNDLDIMNEFIRKEILEDSI